jgi:uncharacterized integral membrane protein (TIGR00698 family)
MYWRYSDGRRKWLPMLVTLPPISVATAHADTVVLNHGPRSKAAFRLLPGIGLCVAVAAAGYGLSVLEHRALGRAWLEGLVLAIILGALIRAFWRPDGRFVQGIAFSAHYLLEAAVAMLGASNSLRAVAAAGPILPAAIAVVVALALSAAYLVGRALGLRHHMALLIACGNAICGNSAIAAVAPVIGAEAADVAAAIAFTALLGVGVVIAMPLGASLLGLSLYGSGVFAGLTVYAVPQVLAATAPMGALALQVGTLVKLVRVLMLGPIVLLLSLATGQRRGGQLVPWFILAFLALAGIRSAGLLPPAAQAPLAEAATVLTVVSMAALGLLVDYAAIRRVGVRAAAAVTVSLSILALLAVGAVKLLAV